MNNSQTKNISVIIPAYNEADSIKSVLDNLKHTLNSLNLENYEIVVVNDASTDNTKEILENVDGIKIVNHSYNKGYGAGLKTGARSAKHEWILTFDADGQHNPKYIEEMLKYTNEFDLISGERQGYQGPWIRQPGKKVIHWLARYLLGHKINDFNCGLRLIKRNEFLRFAHLYPDGFSCSTTSIFAFLKEKLNVKFIPLEINKRSGGKSLVNSKDALTYFMLIIRLIMLFSPLRIFLPVSILFFLAFLGLFLNDMFLSEFNNITDSTVLLFITSILIFFFGLIADQMAAIRRELNRK
jgi:glycosyltransferase involved in cell wall biosynthesis